MESKKVHLSHEQMGEIAFKIQKLVFAKVFGNHQVLEDFPSEAIVLELYSALMLFNVPHQKVRQFLKGLAVREDCKLLPSELGRIALCMIISIQFEKLEEKDVAFVITEYLSSVEQDILATEEIKIPLDQYKVFIETIIRMANKKLIAVRKKQKS